MRLENLIREIDEEMYKKIMDNRTVEAEEARRTSQIVALRRSSTGIFPIRHPRIISLMWTALHLLREYRAVYPVHDRPDQIYPEQISEKTAFPSTD